MRSVAAKRKEMEREKKDYLVFRSKSFSNKILRHLPLEIP